MLKTILVLPDGREISSGVWEENAIRSVKLRQQVNDSKELTLGSVCAGLLEAELQTPNGGLQLTAGEEIAVYKVDEGQNRHLMGTFLLEKPERIGPNTMRLTAYDRVCLLDKDLTQWIQGLQGWPYPLYDFAVMVCEACGVTLKNESIPNGDYPVHIFSAQSITGRKLMQWVGEAAGRFCRAAEDGQIELAWYTPSESHITADGPCFYYQGGLSYEDYRVSPVEKVQVKLTAEDVGVIWPEETGEKNTYMISGNLLLTTGSTEELLPVVKTLYEQLKTVTYTPCKVVMTANLKIRAGDTVQVTDKNGKAFTAYVMTKTQSGQRDTLECTGSCLRTTTTLVNHEIYRGLAYRLLELRKDISGLFVKAEALEETMTDNGENIRQNIHFLQSSIGELAADADSIRGSVSSAQQILDGLSGELQTTKEDIAAMKLEADGLTLEIQKIQDDGVKKVTTTTGTFDETGLTIDQTDSTTKTRVSPDGMCVYRKSYGNEENAVLAATSDGVDATNLHAKTYLIVGGKSRFENYGSNRTGCFWIGA